jgi:hypothetical protein
LATQARKVFYLPDTRFGKNWQVVQTFEHMHLYNVSQTEAVQYNGHAYQEDDYCEEEHTQKSVSDSTCMMATPSWMMELVALPILVVTTT